MLLPPFLRNNIHDLTQLLSHFSPHLSLLDIITLHLLIIQPAINSIVLPFISATMLAYTSSSSISNSLKYIAHFCLPALFSLSMLLSLSFTLISYPSSTFCDFFICSKHLPIPFKIQAKCSPKTVFSHQLLVPLSSFFLCTN